MLPVIWVLYKISELRLGLCFEIFEESSVSVNMKVIVQASDASPPGWEV